MARGRPASLRIRLAAVATLGALIVLSFGAVLIYQGLIREISAAITDELAIRVVDLPADVESGESPPTGRLLTAQVVDPSGAVLEPQGADPLLTDDELARATEGRIVIDREVPLIGEDARLLAQPVNVDGQRSSESRPPPPPRWCGPVTG